MAELHDITVQILIDIRDEIRGLREDSAALSGRVDALAGRVDVLTTRVDAGFAAVQEELQAIDGIVTMLEKRDRETDDDIRKDVRMLKERALRGAL